MSNTIEELAKELVAAGVEQDPTSINYKLKQLYGIQAKPNLPQDYVDIKPMLRRECRALERKKRK